MDMACSLFIDEYGQYRAVDDVRGGELDPKLVMEARDEEVGYVFRTDVYRPSKNHIAWETTGEGAIAT